MALTEQIDNYPGFEDGIDGFTLGEKMQQSAERFGAVTELAEVYKVSLSGRIKTLDTSEGVFQSRTVVIAVLQKRSTSSTAATACGQRRSIMSR